MIVYNNSRCSVLLYSLASLKTWPWNNIPSQVCMLCWDSWTVPVFLPGQILWGKECLWGKITSLSTLSLHSLHTYIFFPHNKLKIIFLIQMRNRYITEEGDFTPDTTPKISLFSDSVILSSLKGFWNFLGSL